VYNLVSNVVRCSCLGCGLLVFHGEIFNIS
jgi:hypothetical protein